MLSAKAPHKKQESITLRDYLQRYSLMKKVRSTGDLTKEGRTFSIQPKPEDEFMTQMNDLKAFLQQKIKDTILKAKIKKKILHLMNLFKKTLDKWRFPLQKKTFTHHPTHFEQFPKKEVNKLPTQPKIPQYQTKTSFEVSNENIPIQKIGKSKTSRLEKKVSINVEDSNEIIPAIIPSIMRLPSNQQLIKNKNLQWMRSSNIIEQKEGDYDDSPRRFQKNTNQSLQQRIRKQKQQKEREKLKLKNETRNYKPPQIEKKISAFDYSILNLNY